MSFHKTMISMLVVVALAACGGGKSAATNTAASTAPAASAAASAAPAASTNAMGGSMSSSTMSSSMKGEMPAGMSADAASLSCGPMKPVWVNTATHVYHNASDRYYGKTKHGGYMCPAAAVKAGYHAAGAEKHAKHGMHAKSAKATPASDGDTDGD